MDALANHADGRLVIETPPDPKTSATSIDLDPLEWIHRITSHIHDPGRHYQRFYGAYSTAGGFAPQDEETACMAAGKHREQDLHTAIQNLRRR